MILKSDIGAPAQHFGDKCDWLLVQHDQREIELSGVHRYARECKLRDTSLMANCGIEV